MRGINPIIKKELYHISRDPKSLIIILIMPILMVFIYGYAISFDLNNINIGILDFSGTELSGRLKNKFLNNKYFTLIGIDEKNTLETFEGKLKNGDIDEILIIPYDFSQKIKRGVSVDIGFVIDGSDSNTANIVYQYNEMIIFAFTEDFRNLKDLISVNTKILFNPELKSAFFFIPGIIAILLTIISALLTSLSMSREKESGSIDLIFISPIKSYEIIIGKTISYVFVALAVESTVLLFSRFWFDLPIRGNLFVLFFFSLIFIFTGLSLGVMISMVTPDQKTAMLATLLVTMLPSLMLSGFIFPITSLGKILRILSCMIPTTYFLKIIRGVVLKGASFSDFVGDAVILIIMSSVLILIAVRKFTKMRRIAG